MATVALGFPPIALTVTLSADADFFTTLVNADGWDSGISIELRFPVPGVDSASWVAWPATIDGTQATWDVSKNLVNVVVAQAAAIGGSGRARVRLHYVDADGSDLLWGEGPIDVA